MSKLDELIQELCPDGVKYRTLEDCCIILDSKRKPITKAKRVAGEFPYYGANGVQDYVNDYLFEGKFVLVGEDGSVLTTSGKPVVNWAEGKIWVNNHAHIISEKPGVNLRYLFYYLQTVNITDLVHGNIPKLTGKDFKAIKTPIPPMEIQKEIVCLLDDFTAKTAELQAELNKEYEARMKQYYYYRNELLDGDFEIPKMKLKDVVVIQRGKRVVKTELTEDGNYPVYQNALAPMGYYHSKNRDKDNTYLISAGAAGSIGYSTNDFWAADDCFTFKCAEILDNKFLYYSLLNKQSAINLKIRNASIPRLSRDSLENLVISIPSLNNQKKIVEILEKFDYACSTLQSNISIEIESRQKQYEFYRDKLLTFKELK